MKLTTLLLIACWTVIPTAQTQTLQSDRIGKPGDWALGEWVTPQADALLKVTVADNDRLEVHLLRARKPDQRDENNPDPALRERSLDNVRIGNDFVFITDHWKGGHLYDPKSGNQYRCVIQYVDPDHIEVTGYVGIKLLGKRMVWERKGHFIQSIQSMLNANPAILEPLHVISGGSDE